MNKAIRGAHSPAAGGNGEVGQRLRALRIAAGLTQSQLAGGRFSKEYVSQIERGKTRPSVETLEWLAGQLDVEPTYLIGGVSAEERGRVRGGVVPGRGLVRTGRARGRRPWRSRPAARRSPRPARADLELRSLLGETWALAQSGSVREALRLLERARDLAESPSCSDVDRAAVLFRFGVCRYHLSSISTAVSLLSSALELADRSGLPCDLLRGDILDWRSRCYRRQRDWQAAREDVERALELAESGRDRRSAAQAYFQASLVAEREGHWLLARTYAERARGYYEELEDRANVGRLLNNLGGLNFTLGNPERAVELLTARTRSRSSPATSPRPGSPCARWRRFISTCPSRPWPRAKRRRRSSSSVTGRTTCRESAPRSSCWAARCSSRIA